MESRASNLSDNLDDDGFLTAFSGWDRQTATELAARNDIGPLTDDHWKVIDFVRQYYVANTVAPPVVKIAKATGLRSSTICTLFPCGIARGAYRLAGLPRPPGCL